MTRGANTSMLGKLVWNHQQESDKLWVKILKNRYFGETCCLDIVKKLGSLTWNSIMKTCGVLRDGYKYRIGNGVMPYLLCGHRLN